MGPVLDGVVEPELLGRPADEEAGPEAHHRADGTADEGADRGTGRTVADVQPHLGGALDVAHLAGPGLDLILRPVRVFGGHLLQRLLVFGVVGETGGDQGRDRACHPQGTGPVIAVGQRLLEVHEPALGVPEPRAVRGVQVRPQVHLLLVTRNILIGPGVDRGLHHGPLGPRPRVGHGPRLIAVAGDFP
ncbi:hypothetical protein ACFFX0_09110 [Citricoccus parietis]|uniref:Uncharacterized protein n=1 Tax=Citricoccus parietis TaxID=592307 RepID=A0ABV5FY53_9MICC